MIGRIKKILTYIGKGFILLCMLLLLQVGLVQMSQWQELSQSVSPESQNVVVHQEPTPYPIPSPNIVVHPISPYPPPSSPIPSTHFPSWNVLSPPTLIPVTPNPITYSLSSATKWKIYSSKIYGLSFRYPESSPDIYEYETGGMQMVEIVINIRTGPTVPANPQNRAVIEVAILPNPEKMSLSQFFAQYGEQIGWYIDVEDTLYGRERELPTYSNHLLQESTDIVYIPPSDKRPEALLLLSLSQEHIYLLEKGYMTDSVMQDMIFSLFIENFHLQ